MNKTNYGNGFNRKQNNFPQISYNRPSKTANGFRLSNRYSNNYYGKKSIDKLQESHQRTLRNLTNKNNPYSTHWANFMLERNYGLECGFNGYFLNGVPVLGLQKKKPSVNNIKILKMLYFQEYQAHYVDNNREDSVKNKNDDYANNNKNEEEEEKAKNQKENSDDDSVSPEADQLFNKNQKNFYQMRKDILEGNINNINIYLVDAEKEDEPDENPTPEKEKNQTQNLRYSENKPNNKSRSKSIDYKKGNNEIQFPEIFKYFDRKQDYY